MLRNVFTKSLREYRWAILGWGVGMGILVYAVYISFTQLAASALTGAAMQSLIQQYRFFGEPIAINTAGGYVTFKYGGLLPVLIGIWTILAGARLVRGEEERGTLDLILATPLGRARVLIEKMAALTVATLLIGLLIALFTLGGMAGAKTSVSLGSALLEGLNISLGALFFGLLALLFSQFLSRGSAAAWAGGLMVLAVVLDGTGRVETSLSGLQRISPIFYYQLSKPLIASYGANAGAMVVLAVLCVLCGALAVPLFVRRDIGRGALADLGTGVAVPTGTSAERAERALAAAERGASLRSVGRLALRRQRMTTAWWVLGLGIVTGYLVIITREMESLVQSLLGGNSAIGKLLGGHDLATNAGFLAGVLFLYLPLLVALFAGLMAYAWPSDLNDGRLELLLSTPEPRWRALLERFGAVLIEVVALAAAIWLAILVGADLSGLTLDVGHVTASAVALVPLGLLTAALVYALAGVLRAGLVLAVLAIFLGLSFLVDLFRLVLNLPDWVTSLSIFHQYGSPITDGLSWGAFLGMLAVALIFLVFALVRFTGRDVERGNAV